MSCKVASSNLAVIVSKAHMQTFQDQSEPSSWEWNRTYGGNNFSQCFSLIQTTDGGYALAGRTGDRNVPGNNSFWLVKVDSTGNVEWTQTYEDSIWPNGARSVIQTSDGGYALVGYVDYNFGFVKVDAYGNIQWNKTYPSQGAACARSVIQTSDGGYAIAGADFWLIKTDAYGNVQWNRSYGGKAEDELYSVVQTAEGGYALGGYTYSFGAGSADFWLVKVDSTGNPQWNETYGGANFDASYCMIETQDGGFALAGVTFSFGPDYSNFWLVKVDSAGNMEWNQTYGGTGGVTERAYSVIQTTDGGYALAGYSGMGSPQFWLVATDSYGNMQWNDVFDSLGDNEVAQCVIQTSDGGFALAGSTNFDRGVIWDFWLVKRGPAKTDVDVIEATVLGKTIGQDFPVNLNVTLANVGDLAETFNLVACLNQTSVGEIFNMTLMSGGSATLWLNCDTTGFAYGKYAMTACALPVPNQTNVMNNNFTVGTLTITISGDINGDFKVSLTDLVLLANAYGTTPASGGTPGVAHAWNPNADIDDNCVVGLTDLVILALHYGRHYP